MRRTCPRSSLYHHLKDEYFRNYTRVVYLAQTDDADLRAGAEEIAGYLQLPLGVRQTGYGLLEERLTAMMEIRDQVLGIRY